jgi:hypothetical protein
VDLCCPDPHIPICGYNMSSPAVIKEKIGITRN